MQKGKWVFVPGEKWDNPENNDYYGFRLARIYLSLTFKTTDTNVRFCLKNNLLPPPRFSRGRQIEAWIDGAKSAIGQWKA